MGRKQVVGAVAAGALLALTGCGIDAVEGDSLTDQQQAAAEQNPDVTDAQDPAGQVPGTTTPAANPLDSCPKNLPANLKPPANQKLAFVYHAIGGQKYECTIPTGGTKFQWVFVEPVATLYNAKNEEVGSHSAGPTWTHKDGSAVTGSKSAEAPAATASDIPWLKLITTPKAGAAQGKFSDVTWIQRLNTQGGVAPPEPCDKVASPDAIFTVGYEADYFFYRRDDANSGNNPQC